jgi:hypothetical protein
MVFILIYGDNEGQMSVARKKVFSLLVGFALKVSELPQKSIV